MFIVATNIGASWPPERRPSWKIVKYVNFRFQSFYIYIEMYVQLAKTKKEIQTNFKNGQKIKIYENFQKSQKLQKCLSFSQISIFWPLVFCKGPYFDSINWFYKEHIRLRSCWVIFENFKGPKREVPRYDKSQMIKKHISKAKNSIISNFGMGREVLFTPLPRRRYG